MATGRGRGRPAKPSPEDVIAEARSRINRRHIIWKLTNDFLLAGGEELHEARVVEAEEALQALAVVLEDAFSRWCIASVKSNGRVALKNLEGDIQKVAEKAARGRFEKLGLPRSYSLNVSVTLRATGDNALKARDVAGVLDPHGHNLTFDNKSAWDSWIGVNLSDPYRRLGHATTEDDWAIVKYVKALRNYVAHRSDRSRIELNSVIKSIRIDRQKFVDVCWPGKNTIKNQAGSHAGDLLLTTPSGKGYTILEGLYVRVTKLLLSLSPKS